MACQAPAKDWRWRAPSCFVLYLTTTNSASTSDQIKGTPFKGASPPLEEPLPLASSSGSFFLSFFSFSSYTRFGHSFFPDGDRPLQNPGAGVDAQSWRNHSAPKWKDRRITEGERKAYHQEEERLWAFQ